MVSRVGTHGIRRSVSIGRRERAKSNGLDRPASVLRNSAWDQTQWTEDDVGFFFRSWPVDSGIRLRHRMSGDGSKQLPNAWAPTYRYYPLSPGASILNAGNLSRRSRLAKRGPRSQGYGQHRHGDVWEATRLGRQSWGHDPSVFALSWVSPRCRDLTWHC